MFIVLTTATLPTQCEGWRDWFGGIFKYQASCNRSQQYSWQKIGAVVGLTVAGIGIFTYFLKYRAKKNPKLQELENTKAIYLDGLAESKRKNDIAGINHYEQALKMIDSEIERASKQ